ncbi:hypothetical protein [Serratia ficaria]|uniref:hypothetical protein n=1 Tax=Serratia ficaria TaxID=61651 RepID=UPI00217B7F6C|nr:hypothetical protein [Serratia ficaria]CAI1019126.1 Uncharacterised protein [Serratia ficaria]CAI1991446.1 Uncharacterised protein [Serratia ficaria]
MTQTLTTDQLRARAAHLRAKSEQWRGQGYAGKAARLDGDADALDELAANREAQPVALVDRRSAASGSICWQNSGKDLPHGTELFTAPPAPAVPDGFCIMPLTLTAENGAKGALSGEFKVSRTVRCHECGGEGCDDCADAGEFEEEITVPWDTIKDIYRAAVDTCRAAMLAQPVSQGYKLVPVEPQQK